MEATTVERINVDPRSLLVDLNIRQDTQLNKDFVASIKELGVLVPIGAVRTSAGEIRVRYAAPRFPSSAWRRFHRLRHVSSANARPRSGAAG